MTSARKPPRTVMKKRMSLNGRWKLAGMGRNGESIEAVARVPGVVHWDLERAGVIGNPFEDAVEDDVQWVGQQSWDYTTTFRVAPSTCAREHIELVFEGLDTFAEIALNGVRLGKTDNMFTSHRFDVKSLVLPGDNSLAVRFLSALEEGHKLHQERQSAILSDWDRNPRAYCRKAQYSFGWDWGPRITTCGIWRNVYIEVWNDARIDSVYWRTRKADAGCATVEVAVEVLGSRRVSAEAELSLGEDRHHVRLSRRELGARAKFVGEIELADPALWWPNGLGEPNLYDAKVTLRAEGRSIDVHKTRIGVRTAGIRRETDDEGETFTVTVNGCDVFCKGADWIPADIYLPRVTPRDYDAWIELAETANMNMLRVWGGGIYEDEAFYRSCDERGIMVWQDFMFACAPYPEDDWFVKSVEREAAHVVKALRNHPSIMLWCGNNENQWAIYTSWWGKLSRWGKKLYDCILPAVTRKLDPSRPYWPGSPYGGKDPNSEARGDRHNWTVWSQWQDYSAYLKDKGRFLSEYGWQAAPAMETVAKFGPLRELHPQHPLFERHNKMVEGCERLARFLAGSVRTPKDLEEYVHLTQVVQAEAIKTGSMHWRSRMMKCSGVLYWQLNDCWPVVSWAACDYARRPKGLYYYSRRFFAPVAAWVVKRPEGVFGYVINDSPAEITGEIALQAMTFDGNEVGCIRESVDLAPNAVHTAGPFKAEMLGVTDPTSVFLMITFKPTEGESIRDIGFLARPKHLKLPKPKLTWKVQASDGGVRITLSTKNLAYGVYMRLPWSEARFSDNFLTIPPGGTAEVALRGKHLRASAVSRKLRVLWMKGG